MKSETHELDFELPDFEAVRDRLSPADCRLRLPDGMETKSEVLPIQWARVDFNTGTVRLDPGTTKNDEGRVFPYTQFSELAEVLHINASTPQRLNVGTEPFIPWVFH